MQVKALAQATKPVVAWVQYNSFAPAAFQIDFAQYKDEYTRVRHPSCSLNSRHPCLSVALPQGSLTRVLHHKGMNEAMHLRLRHRLQ